MSEETITKEEKTALKQVNKELKEDNKIRYMATCPNLVDLVENDEGKLEYLMFDPMSKTCTASPVIIIDGKTYTPPTKDLLPHNLLFPRKEEVLHYIFERKNSQVIQTDTNNINNEGNSGDSGDMRIKEEVVFSWDVELYDQIIAYYQERAELPEDSLYDVLTAWAFHTYAMERADFSPIIYFLGLPEKGKSRMLKSMIYIARRGLRKISITDAQILRDCTHIDATLALDMMSLWDKVEKAGSEDVFLNRPERGVDVSRVNRPDKGPFFDTEQYTVFGPTIFATNETIHEILDTRAIPIIMVNSTKEFNITIKPQDSLPIKEKLVAWRACTMGDEWPEVKRIAKSRLGDITKPLYQIMLHVNPARGEALKEVVCEIEKRRLSEKIDSMSGQTILALISCQESIERGCIKGQIIANKYNESNANSKYPTQSRTILNRLRAMGLETRMMGGGVMGVIWNETRINALKLEFGIDIPSIPITPLSPLLPLSPPEDQPYYTKTAHKIIGREV